MLNTWFSKQTMLTSFGSSNWYDFSSHPMVSRETGSPKKGVFEIYLIKRCFFSVNFENESLQRYLELTPT